MCLPGLPQAALPVSRPVFVCFGEVGRDVKVIIIMSTHLLKRSKSERYDVTSPKVLLQRRQECGARVESPKSSSRIFANVWRRSISYDMSVSRIHRVCFVASVLEYSLRWSNSSCVLGTRFFGTQRRIVTPPTLLFLSSEVGRSLQIRNFPIFLHHLKAPRILFKTVSALRRSVKKSTENKLIRLELADFFAPLVNQRGARGLIFWP